MGIPDLRRSIEACEEIVPIAQLAEEHYAEYGRPLKIAVDEADWRFHSVSPAQIQAMRKNEPRCNPLERGIFHRICKILPLNIRLVFVSDGPDVPPKRGRDAGRRVDRKLRALLNEILDGLGVAHIEAPGEAEAECCRLQTLGLVDAVWSTDSDCLMFGCTFWIRDHRVSTDTSKKTQHNAETKRDEKRVRVVRAEKLKEKCRLDRQGCVLFAMLAGGDYNEGGLPKCGADNALKAAQASLGRSLCSRQNQDDCSKWGANTLTNYFKRTAPGITVPPSFPRYELLQFYNQPKVHSDDWLRDYARENMDYDHPSRETHLFLKACPPINMFWKKYLNHVGPILLSRILAAWDEPLPGTAPYGLTLVNTRQTAATAQPSHAPLERKVKFRAFDVTELKVQDLAAYVTQRDKPIPDINEALGHVVTYEMPAFFLRKVLPIPIPTVTEPSETGNPPKRKHSTSDEQDTNSPVSAKKMCQPAKPATSVTQPSITFSGKSASSPMQSSTLATPSKHSLQHSPLASTTSPATPVNLSNNGLRRPQPRGPRPSPSEKFALLLRSVKKE